MGLILPGRCGKGIKKTGTQLKTQVASIARISALPFRQDGPGNSQPPLPPRIPVFLFATDVVEMLPGQNIEFAPQRFNVAVLPVIVVVPGGQDELSFKI
jgi:hypothetical protein